MVFQLHINSENDAFHPDTQGEIARILREVADEIEAVGIDLYWFETILDSNGNYVGRYALKER